jgi:F0F1-type ATP synthase assembly protein I
LNKKKISGSIFTYSTIGLQLAVTILLFILGGYKLDEHLNRAPVFTTIGAAVGMVIGFYHLIKELQGIDRKEKEERKERKK